MAWKNGIGFHEDGWSVKAIEYKSGNTEPGPTSEDSTTYWTDT